MLTRYPYAPPPAGPLRVATTCLTIICLPIPLIDCKTMRVASSAPLLAATADAFTHTSKPMEVDSMVMVGEVHRDPPMDHQLSPHTIHLAQGETITITEANNKSDFDEQVKIPNSKVRVR